MRSIFAAIMMLSASTALVHTAQAQTRNQPSYGPNQFQSDEKSVERENGSLDRPASRDRVTGAGQVDSEENAHAEKTEQENTQVDRKLKGICRGC